MPRPDLTHKSRPDCHRYSGQLVTLNLPVLWARWIRPQDCSDTMFCVLDPVKDGWLGRTLGT